LIRLWLTTHLALTNKNLNYSCKIYTIISHLCLPLNTKSILAIVGHWWSLKIILEFYILFDCFKLGHLFKPFRFFFIFMIDNLSEINKSKCGQWSVLSSCFYESRGQVRHNKESLTYHLNIINFILVEHIQMMSTSRWPFLAFVHLNIDSLSQFACPAIRDWKTYLAKSAVGFFCY